MKNPVERLRCANVVAERFLDDDTSALGGARFRQIAQPLFRTEGANGQVMCRLSRSIQFFADRLKRGGVCVVAVHIPQQPDQLVEGRSVDSAVFLEAVLERTALLQTREELLRRFYKGGTARTVFADKITRTL